MFICDGAGCSVVSLAFDRHGGVLAGTTDGRVLRFPHPGAAAELIHQFEPASGQAWVNALSLSPGGLLLVGHAGGWSVFDDRAGNAREHTHKPTLPVAAAAFLNDSMAVVGLGDRARESAGRLELWSVSGDPRRLQPHFAEPKGVRSIAIDAAGGRIAWAAGHKKITIWNPRSQDPRIIPLSFTSPALAFDAAGLRLAAAREWGAAILDPATGNTFGTLAGHTGRVTCLAFHPNGRMLITGSWDESLRLWDTASGAALGSLTGPTGRVYALALSPDGLQLAAAGDSGRVVIWDVD